MLPRPNGAVGTQAHPVPDDVKMLPPLKDMLDDNALMVARLIAVLLFGPLDDLPHLFIGKALVLEGVDADMVERLLYP